MSDKTEPIDWAAEMVRSDIIKANELASDASLFYHACSTVEIIALAGIIGAERRDCEKVGS